jgi:hypothetical protein
MDDIVIALGAMAYQLVNWIEGTLVMLTARSTVRQGNLFIKRQKLNIAIRATYGRLDYLFQSQSQFLSCVVDLCNHPRVLLRITNDASFSHFPTAYFKLRLDERD